MEYIPSFRDNLRDDIQPSFVDSLMHYGVKGMKKGVRRWTDENGNLTPEGIEHYKNAGSKEQIEWARRTANSKTLKPEDIVQKDLKRERLQQIVSARKQQQANQNVNNAKPQSAKNPSPNDVRDAMATIRKRQAAQQLVKEHNDKVAAAERLHKYGYLK